MGSGIRRPLVGRGVRGKAAVAPGDKVHKSRSIDKWTLNCDVALKVYCLFVSLAFGQCPGFYNSLAVTTKNVLSLLRGCSIIGSGSGFTVHLGLDSLGKSNDLGVSNVSRIHFAFRFIVNPDPIIEYALGFCYIRIFGLHVSCFRLSFELTLRLRTPRLDYTLM